MKHLRFGGSRAARTIGCPAWHKMADALPPDDVAGPPAHEGTMLHDCMEELYGNTDMTPEQMLEEGRAYKGQHLTQDLIDAKLQPAINTLEELINDLDIRDWELEPMVIIDEDIGGSIDFLGISGDLKTVLVLDYKFGYNRVDAENNAQLLFYALAAATDSTTNDWFDEVECLVLAIIQPNDNGPVLQTWVTDMERIDVFEDEYLAAVDTSENDEPEPNPGDWCKYCPAKATCPAKTGAALMAARVTEITADRLAEYLPLAAVVEDWAKAIKKMAHEQLELGVPIDGYKLVNKRASRVWNDQPAVEDKVRKAKKLLIQDGFDLKLKSPAGLEKVCKSKGIPFKQYEKFISAVSSGTTLAPASDKRPAALPIAGLEELNKLG